jgi:hypothetical protein
MVSKKKSRVRKAKSEKPTSRLRSATSKRTISKSSLWRKKGLTELSFNGLQVWAPVDPYIQGQRDEFRAAMQNSYVYKANWIITKLVCGQGYITDVVPRSDEDIDDERIKIWKSEQPLFVPYFNKEMSPLQIKNYIDKISNDMDLSENIFNGYITAREQGRCVLAMTPIDENDDGVFDMPTSIRLIRPEFTLRPYLDQNTSELVGVQIVGLTSAQQFILPTERMIYIENGFNQELFADHYGDSQVDRVTNVANVLNLIFTDDFLHAAESTWHQPKVFGVPIQPQDFGNEQNVLDTFLTANSQSKGQDIAVVQDPDGEGGVELLSSSTNSGDIAGLERIVIRCIKAILAYYNIPAFMLSEGDKGALGGNSNSEEIDMFINSEILPEKLKLEKMLQSQYYDKILRVLFRLDDADDLPIKIIHTYNKPKITSMFRPDLYEIGKDMVENGLMEKSRLPEFVGFEEFTTKDTTTLGGDASPQKNTWVDKGPLDQSLTVSWNPNNWNSTTSPVRVQKSKWPVGGEPATV